MAEGHHFLFELTIPHIAYACLGGFVVFFGMFSLFLRERLYIGEANWAFLFGVIIGPYGAGIFDPRGWGGSDHTVVNTITLEVTRVVLAIGVFAIGVELPKQYMKKHWKSLAFLLGPVMTWGWFVSAGLIYALIPGLNFLSALVVAACLTPTDPILAAAVIGGKYADKHVPAHLRHLLAAESGCNDGAAFPFLFIGLYLTLDKDTGTAVKDWFLLLWLYQIALGTVIGALIGIGFRHLMKFCERQELIDRQSYVAQYVSLALLTIGVCTMLGSDDLLAAFACGTAFAWDGFFNRQTEESVFSSVIDLLFNVAAFVFLGAWMPFNDFHAPELTIEVWRLIVIGILVLVLRRLPVIVALYKWIPDVKTFREAVFSGHFGPIGVGAVFISTLAAERLPHPHEPPQSQAELLAASIQPIVAFMVLCSILVHGLSIPFFSLGRRVHSVRREWSRRSTIDTNNAPEWTQQTRRIRPGEDVVINRDSMMERGEIPREEREKAERGTREGSPDDSLTAKEAEKAHEREKAPERADSGIEVGEDKREEAPPDGDEILNEWQEGPHKVVEKRAGPGEEVEVEVHKNAFADDRPKMTSIFRGEAGHVYDAAHMHLSRLKQHAEQMEHELARKYSPNAAAQRSAVADDDDEGWQSDGSANDAPSSSSGAPLAPSSGVRSSSPAAATTTAAAAAAAAPPSPRVTHVPHKKKHPLFAGRGRRRNSMRRALHSSVLPQQQGDGTEARGRPMGVLNRIDSLDSAHRRTESPARSVRWADADTPRSPLSPAGSEGVSTSPEEGEASPRHITFVESLRRA